MALVYQSAAFGANPAAPGAHALVIGVGKYPHLLGGDADIVDDPMGLRQLESPPVSAKAFAKWLIPKADPQLVKFSNPDAPLATVEMVLSPDETYTSPAGNATPVELATFDNIQRAFDMWLPRLQNAPGSLAIFYALSAAFFKNGHAICP